MKNYGEIISKLRKEKGLTQADVGRHLNISYQAVSKWENNLSEPDLDSLQKMAILFDVPITVFFGEVLETKSKKSSQVATRQNIFKTKPWFLVAGLGVLIVLLFLIVVFVPNRLSPTGIYNKVGPSIFYIETEGLNSEKKESTGFFLNNTGLAVTNYSNVIENTKEAYIYYNDKRYEVAKLVGVDDGLDIAIIQVDIPRSQGIKYAYNAGIAEIIYTYNYEEKTKKSFNETVISKVQTRDGNKAFEVLGIVEKGSVVINQLGKVLGIVSNAYDANPGMSMAVSIPEILGIKQNINVSLQEYFETSYTLNFLDEDENSILTRHVKKGYVIEELKYHGHNVYGVYEDKNFTIPANLNEEITTSKNYYIDYEPITYTIVFLPNGASGEMQEQTLKFGEEVRLNKCNYFIEGKMLDYWLFNGWHYYDEQTISNLSYKDNEVLEFKAVWVDLFYTISFDGNGAYGSMPSITYEPNDTITLPEEDFIIGGYTFKCWECDGVQYQPGQIIGRISENKGRHTFKAIWEPITYSIYYKSNYSYCSYYEKIADVKFDQEFVLPEYCFKNYQIAYLTKRGLLQDTTYNVGDTVINLESYQTDVILEVVVKPIEYTVKYWFDDENYYEQSYTWGYGYLLGADYPDYKNPGYHYQGFTAQKFNNKFFGVGQRFDNTCLMEPNEVIDVKVVWEPIEYDVIVEANSLNYHTITCLYAQTYKVPLLEDTKKGYSLTNYSLYINNTFIKTLEIGEDFISLTTNPDDQIRLKPNWEANLITLNYYVDNQLYKTEQVRYDAWFKMPSYLQEKEDVWFNGWVTNNQFYNQGTTDYNKFAENADFYALFSKKLEGDGTEASPYLIKTYEDLCSLTFLTCNSNFKNSYFKLNNDIDCQNQALPSINTFQYAIFDGNNKIIKNAHLTENFEDKHVSLFGILYYATVKNLGVENYTITTEVSSVAPFANYIEHSTIENCWATGKINVNFQTQEKHRSLFISGFVGQIQSASVIKNSYAHATMEYTSNASYYELYSFASAVYAWAEAATIENCYALTSGTNKQVFAPDTNQLDIKNSFMGTTTEKIDFLANESLLENLAFYQITNEGNIVSNMETLFDLDYLNQKLNFDLSVWVQASYPCLKSFGGV